MPISKYFYERKEKLNYTLLKDKELIAQAQIANSSSGLNKLQKHLKQLGIPLSKVLICCENTGVYNHPLIMWGKQNNANLWIENAKTIRKSMALVRGKNDKDASYHIALYASRFQDRSVLYELPREAVQKLKVLTKTRKNLIGMKTQIEQRLSESKDMKNAISLNIMKKHYKTILADLKKQVKEIDQEIKKLMASDSKLNELFEICSSVEGVGPVLAAEMIAESGEFERIKASSQMACHAGVAPFVNSSGKSINKKPKVSLHANKKMKSLLFMGAMSAAHGSGELADYYQRKIKEGKHAWSVYNAIANKIIHRIYACVRDQRMYQKKYNRFSTCENV